MDDKSVWFMLAVGLVILLGLVYSAVRLDDRADWCSERNGIMVKSISGWQCIDAEVIK